jgi:two-component system, OmpR family, phosphate regulon sensor histidine kinase PhoR
MTLKQLKKEEEKLSLLLSNVPNPIIAINHNNELVFANDAAKKIFVLDQNKISNDLNLQNEAIFEKEDRTYIISRQDSNDFYLCVLNDITPQKEAEKQRKEFVDSASHELKTPLTSIIGFNELIGMSTKDAKIKEYTDKVSLSSKRMLSVVQDMLAISALEEEKAQEDLPLISLKNVANDAIKKLTFLAEEKKVSVSLRGDAQAMVEDKDAYLIIKNLIENAILYNVPNGSVKVTLNDKAITVEDTGIGISEKDQERVFERFYRVDKSHSRQNGGTGLGLSIVKHAVMKYDGKINLSSSLGYGTTIRVIFSK